jgi:hypothetical protein
MGPVPFGLEHRDFRVPCSDRCLKLAHPAGSCFQRSIAPSYDPRLFWIVSGKLLALGRDKKENPKHEHTPSPCRHSVPSLSPGRRHEAFLFSFGLVSFRLSSRRHSGTHLSQPPHIPEVEHSEEKATTKTATT